VLYRTTGGVDVIRDSFRSPYPCAAPRADWGNALAINTDTGAILVGDADRGLEERVCRTGPWRNDVQFLPVAAWTFALLWTEIRTLQHSGLSVPEVS
jgi:hypothetical protein